MQSKDSECLLELQIALDFMPRGRIELIRKLNIHLLVFWHSYCLLDSFVTIEVQIFEWNTYIARIKYLVSKNRFFVRILTFLFQT